MPKASNDNIGPNSSAKNLGAGKCPICDNPQSARYKPFCTKRCADIDLGNWLKGNYAIPAQTDLEEEEDAPSLLEITNARNKGDEIG